VQHGEEDDALPGQDSFIDVVCNMVGILIVLVMIVGVRATGANSEPTADGPPAAIRATAASYAAADDATASQLQAERERAMHAHKEIEDAVERVVDLGVQSVVVDARRQQLSIVKAAVEQEIAERRAKLSGKDQRQFDVQRQIAEAEIKLHELTQEQISVVAESAQVETIECVPTPIAKEVTSETVHVRLKHGLLGVLPVEELMHEVERRGVDYLRNGLSHRNYAEEMFGPIDGFRMRFLVARRDELGAPGAPLGEGGDQSRIFLKFAFLPMSEQIGQPIEQALLPDSKFMAALRAKRSTTPTVVAWVYGDSYAELRTLKRAMWNAGTPLAVNPAVDEYPIAIATGGARMVAQ
jgi:hypothetical protein